MGVARRMLLARRRTFSPARIVWLLGLGMALSLLGDATLYVVLPTDFGRAGITAVDVGLMLSANRAIRIVLNGPYGFLIERIPRRRMLIPALFMGALASLCYTVPGFWPLLTGRLLWGAAWAGILLGGQTVILDIATDENRGWMVGRFQMWFLIGAGGSSLLGGVLFDAIGYASTFYVSALVILAGALGWLFFLPETRPDRAKQIRADLSAESQPQATPAAQTPMSRLPLFAAIAIQGLNRLILSGIAATLLPVLVLARIGGEVAVAGLFVVQLASFTGLLRAVNTGISVFSAPLSGWLTDRSGNRWPLVAAALALGVVSLSMSGMGSGSVVVLATILTAIASGVLVTQVTAVVGDYARPGSSREHRRGRILGILNIASDVGAAAGPMIAFALLPVVGLVGAYGLGALLLSMTLPGALWIMLRVTGQRLDNSILAKPR